MAFRFDSTKTQYLESAVAVVTAAPATLACWFCVDDVANNYALLSIGASGAASAYSLRAAGGIAGDPVQAIPSNSSSTASTSTSFFARTWHHGCAVFAGAADRRAYLDGSGKGTSVASVAASGLNRTRVGGMANNGTSYTSGLIARPAIWAAVLSDDEIWWLGGQLKSGRMRDPWAIRRGDLVFARRLRVTISAPLVGCQDLAAVGTSNDFPLPVRDARIDAPDPNLSWLYAASTLGGGGTGGSRIRRLISCAGD